MRCISNAVFTLDNRTHVIVGLCPIANNYETKIALVAFGEKIIFSPSEWKVVVHPSTVFAISQYFGSLINSFSIEGLPNHQVLVNTIGTREIILKSCVTWNTVRIKEKEFHAIIHLLPCIEKHLKRLEARERYATYVMQLIIRDVLATIEKELDETKQLHSIYLNTSTSRLPIVREETIQKEIINRATSWEDLLAIEMCHVFSDVMASEVEHRIQNLHDKNSEDVVY